MCVKLTTRLNNSQNVCQNDNWNELETKTLTNLVVAEKKGGTSPLPPCIFLNFVWKKQKQNKTKHFEY